MIASPANWMAHLPDPDQIDEGNLVSAFTHRTQAMRFSSQYFNSPARPFLHRLMPWQRPFLP